MTPATFTMLAISGLLIASYVFSLFASKTKFPSIILLIVTGIVAAHSDLPLSVPQGVINHLLRIFGSIGLIFIILEAVLDIKIKPDNAHILRKSLVSASFLFLTTCAVLSISVMILFRCPFNQAIIYAIPLSIISSAVAIPSTEHLRKADRMMVTYETAFSDILGILVFNFLIAKDISFESIGFFALQTTVGLGLSVIVSFFLIYVMTRVEEGAVYALILASLAFLYTLGKILHLPSLFLILVFGMLVNNRNLLKSDMLQKIYEHENYTKLLRNLKIVVIESTFVIRTIFFFIFGYSIQLAGFEDPFIWLCAFVLLAAMYAVRYGQLTLSRDALSPYMSIIPRGLVTILLFYSIPEKFEIKEFDTQILTLIVMVSCLVMAAGLIFHNKLHQRELSDARATEPVDLMDQIHHLR